MFANCVSVLYSNWNCSFGSTTGTHSVCRGHKQHCAITQNAVKTRQMLHRYFLSSGESEKKFLKNFDTWKFNLNICVDIVHCCHQTKQLTFPSVHQFQVPRPWAQRSDFFYLCFIPTLSHSLYVDSFLLNLYSRRAARSKQERKCLIRGHCEHLFSV